MIKLNPKPEFEQVVRLTVPGMQEPSEVTMTFRHMTAADSARWYESSKDRPLHDAVGEIVLGWKGVVDDAERPVEFSQDALRQLLTAYQPSGLEILRAWQIALTESRVKN